MDSTKLVERLKNIDFGDIDGSGEPKLEQYFLDSDYWNRVVENKTFFVIGKKGTGKSSIYRMVKGQGADRGVIVENKDFGDFPFERLLSLDDDNFAKPNQYQSIWKNLVLNVFSKMIADNPIMDDENNTYFLSISEYASNCLGNIVEMHKEVITRTTKNAGNLSFSFLSASHEAERTLNIGSGNSNISAINSALEGLIVNYLKTCSPSRKAIIQFDRLDDNYNQYQNVEQYYQAIISLFKVVYKINQEFRACNIEGSKVILYLRSDILNELGKRDAESARWDDYCLMISWSIVNKNDWENPKLLQMLNKRIYASTLDEDINFYTIFDSYTIALTSGGKPHDVFRYIVDRTMHRPRDLIQFCKYIQKEAVETNKLFFRTIKNAEKNYGHWLVNSELANEINPILENTDALYELLKLLGRQPFSFSDFCDRHVSAKNIDLSADDLAYYLYDVGIFQNIDTTCSPTTYRSVYRNKGRLNRDMKIIIHRGVWTGINA